MIYTTKQEGLYQNKVNSSLFPPVTVKWTILTEKFKVSKRVAEHSFAGGQR